MATAGALFMYLADEIGEQARLTQVDLAVAQFFHNHGAPWAVRLFEAITFFGNSSTLGVIGLVTALVLAFHRRWFLLPTLPHWIGRLRRSTVIRRGKVGTLAEVYALPCSP
jgi:hypothetical protein